MKAQLIFNLDDEYDAERFRRVNKADDMASILYRLCGMDIEKPPKEVSDYVYRAVHDEGVFFSDIWT
jgi:hypothetical protein